MARTTVTPVTNRTPMLEVLLSRSEPRNRDDRTAVLWVFRDYDNRWCVRKEGGDIEDTFTIRGDAVAFARQIAQTWGSYILYLQLRDGRITRELYNLGCH